MKLVAVTCGLCGSSEAERLFEARNNRLKVVDDRFTLRRCLQCGLVYISPRPAIEEMGAFYQGVYYESPVPIQNRMIHYLNQRFGRERVDYVRHWKQGGLVLDVGCGAGDFLMGMAERGYIIQGIETSPDAVACLPEKIRPHVRCTAIEEADFLEDSFDLITLWHVLEHVPEPLESLRRLRKLIRSNGVLVIEVPNFGSLEARWLGPHWFALDVPRHFWHFTPTTLCRMVKAAGFGQVQVESSLVRRSFFMATYLLSNGPGIQDWGRQHLGPLCQAGWLAAAWKIIGLSACLAGRLVSPQMIRLVAIP